MWASASSSRWAVDTPGGEFGADHVEDFADDPAGLTHLLDLGTRLAGDHQVFPVPASSASAASSAAVTAAIGWSPSMVRSTPPSA